MIAARVAALAGFIHVERRAAEPILPLRLFRNRIFVVSCSVGFIVGLAMFGAVTYMPLYLQVVKGVSPSTAGLQLTPMMAGMLVTSIAQRPDHQPYRALRAFPIAGTAIVTVGPAAAVDAGIGDEHAGRRPATCSCSASGSAWSCRCSCWRCRTRSITPISASRPRARRCSARSAARSGSRLFGAIFTAGLAAQLAGALPSGATVPTVTEPAAIQALPAALRAIYARRLHRRAAPGVSDGGAASARLGFVLAWFLEDVPLRGPARADTIGESFAMPRDATSLEELEQIVSRLRTPREPLAGLPNDRRGGRRRARARRNLAAGPPLPRRGTAAARSRRSAANDLPRSARAWWQRTWRCAAPTGRSRLRRAAATRSSAWSRSAAPGWRRFSNAGNPEEHDEVRAMLDRLAQTLMADPPAMPEARGGAGESATLPESA